MHGEPFDKRYAGCGCGPCRLARSFVAFARAPPPDRPARITTRLEAAQFFRWIAHRHASAVDLVDEAEVDGDEAEALEGEG
jgi:hypothetical protein